LNIPERVGGLERRWVSYTRNEKFHVANCCFTESMHGCNKFCSDDSTSNRHYSIICSFCRKTVNLTGNVYGVRENNVKKVSFIEWDDRIKVDGIRVVLTVNLTLWCYSEALEEILGIHNEVDVLATNIDFEKIGI
jgi:hypothetical protein